MIEFWRDGDQIVCMEHTGNFGTLRSFDAQTFYLEVGPNGIEMVRTGGPNLPPISFKKSGELVLGGPPRSNLVMGGPQRSTVRLR